VSAAALAIGLKALVRAARRALDRCDREEYVRLMDEADEHCALMVEAMPQERRR
jgi:hypothetical protein